MTNENVPATVEPKWASLNLATLKKAAKETLGLTPKKRTLKGAYAELEDGLRKTDRVLEYTCQECGSLLDAEMPRCWACGLVLNDDEEDEKVVNSELISRAKRLGIASEGLERDDLLAKIEAAETKARSAKVDADLHRLESKRLNVEAVENMPDGWKKKELKHYITYFDSNGVRRIAILHRGLKVEFSVEDGILDGFPDVEFFGAEERRKRHHGRTNYIYSGDIYKTALDLVKRIFGEY